MNNSGIFDLSNDNDKSFKSAHIFYNTNLESSINKSNIKKNRTEIINKYLKEKTSKILKFEKEKDFEKMIDEEIRQKLKIILGEGGLKNFIEKYNIPKNISNKQIFNALKKSSYNQEEASLLLLNDKK